MFESKLYRLKNADYGISHTVIPFIPDDGNGNFGDIVIPRKGFYKIGFCLAFSSFSGGLEIVEVLDDDVVVTSILIDTDMTDSFEQECFQYFDKPTILSFRLSCSSLLFGESWVRVTEVKLPAMPVNDFGVCSEALASQVADRLKVMDEAATEATVLSETTAKGLKIIEGRVNGHMKFLSERVAELEARVVELESEEVIEIDPMPLEEQLDKARENVDRRRRRRTKSEKILDSYLHAVLDACKRLKTPGGWYVIDNLEEDVREHFPELEKDTLDFSFEEAIQSALRWCAKRSRWFTRKRFWVEPAKNWLIIKHDRFWFRQGQVKQNETRDSA